MSEPDDIKRNRPERLSMSPALPFWTFLGLLFGQLFLALWPSWNDGTYYDYGMLAPVVGVFMFVSRWKDQVVSPNWDRLTNRPIGPLVIATTGVVIITILRLIESVDSGWRAPLYVHWLTVWAVTGYFLWRLLGVHGSRPFIPVALLTLLAVPLPSAVESSLIHNLTSGVVDLSVAANRYAGFPVIRSGETLFADGVPLYVSDGCSGIRSFQGSLFAAFVVGEFLRLGWANRILLIFCGVAFAFLANSGRVIYLVRHAFAHGNERLEQLHDLSGYISLGVTFAMIIFLGWLLERSGHTNSSTSDARNAMAT